MMTVDTVTVNFYERHFCHVTSLLVFAHLKDASESQSERALWSNPAELEQSCILVVLV